MFAAWLLSVPVALKVSSAVALLADSETCWKPWCFCTVVAPLMISRPFAQSLFCVALMLTLA